MQLSTQTDKDLMRYALGAVALLLIIPFNLAWRVPPYMDLYQDAFVVFTICLLFLIVLSYGKLSLPLSRPAVYFLLLAGYWVLQSGILDLSYPEQNWRVALMFVTLVALCWSVQTLLQHYGREKVETWVMWAIIIGVTIQSLVVILQFSGLAEHISWLVYYVPEKGIGGQMGQRNLLGHQLMWGVLAATYLTSQGRIKFYFGVGIIVFFGAIMGLVNSRTIVAYIVALLFFLSVIRIVGGRQQGKVLKHLFFAVIWVFAAQWLIPFLLGLLDVSAQSGVKRLLVSSAIEARVVEWKKAWDIFLSHPIWGSGWHSYGYQSFLRDITFKPAEVYHQDSYPSHCHNLVLQIMAEMGIVGLILVLGGLIWITLPMLRQPRRAENQIILALLTVTLTHSLVEFPLWLTYFLVAATVFVALGQPQTVRMEKLIAIPRIAQLLLLVVGLSGALVTGVLFGLHQWRVSQLIRSSNGEVTMRMIHISARFQLGRVIPLLAPYRDLNILNYSHATDENINWTAVVAADKLSRYRPTERALMLHGLYLYRKGEKQASLEWVKKVWNFYPRLVPGTMKSIYNASPMFKELEQPAYEACVRLRKIGFYPKTFKEECELPPDKTALKSKKK